MRFIFKVKDQERKAVWKLECVPQRNHLLTLGQLSIAALTSIILVAPGKRELGHKLISCGIHVETVSERNRSPQ